jgi:tagatose 6-phosphate kinase
MILTVTLNAAWDKTYFISGLRPGGTHSVAEVRGCPGGKGVNVARVVKALGGRVLATGLAGGPTGRAIVDGLAAEGIESAFLSVGADSRTTLAVVDRAGGGVTEFREPGGPVTDEEFAAFLVHLDGLLAGVSFCVFSGSLPPGLPSDAYAQTIRVAQGRKVLSVLDTSGPALVAGVSARPFLIKPNAEEAVGLARAFGLETAKHAAAQDAAGRDAGGAVPAGRDPVDRSEVASAIGLAPSLGGAAAAELVVLTLGELGAVAYCADEFWHAVVRVEGVRNPVGSGDALAAAMVVALERGDGLKDALSLGVAAGAANALTETAGQVRPEDVERLREGVEVRRL